MSLVRSKRSFTFLHTLGSSFGFRVYRRFSQCRRNAGFSGSASTAQLLNVCCCMFVFVSWVSGFLFTLSFVCITLTLQQVISVVEEICTNRTNIKYYWINSTTQLYIRSQHSIPLLISDYSLDSTCVINTISPSHSSFCLFKSLKSVKISSATVTRYENVHQVFGSRKDTNSCFHSTATYSPTINNEWVLCSISTFDWKSKPFI